MLPLNTRADVIGVRGKAIRKVLRLEEALGGEFDARKCLLWIDREVGTSLLHEQSWAGIVFSNGVEPLDIGSGICISGIQVDGVIAPGDVIRVTEGSSRISVLYRRGSNSNTLLATERCNSFCLMCSQPPKEDDDSWLADEMLETIPLIDRSERQLGISGGEPTLLGDDLWVVIHQAKEHLPNTGLHILTNGRRFKESSLAREACALRHPDLTWAVPLYSDCPETHDYIVQSRGAWDETVEGLYNLARYGASIEIRVVVQLANFERLGELSYFLFRNFSFSEHVAFMGLEPIGFAKHNRRSVWIDPADCVNSLGDAVHFLANRGVEVSIYNFPLCTLPRDLWKFCPRSISDWKNVYLPQCAECDVQEQCCGFFSTLNEAWISRAVEPVKRGYIAKEGVS